MTKKNTNLSHFNKEEVPNAKGLTFGIVVRMSTYYTGQAPWKL